MSAALRRAKGLPLATPAQEGQVLAARARTVWARAAREAARLLEARELDRVDLYGNTLLHTAAGGRDLSNTPAPEFVRRLLDNKADVNARGMGAQTPLIMAIYGKQREAVAMLMAAGADPSLKAGEYDAFAFAKDTAPELLPLLGKAALP